MKINKNLVSLLWSAGIVLCIVLSLFSVLFTSCTQYRDADEKDSAAAPSEDFNIDTEPPEATKEPETPDTPEPPVQAGARLGTTPDAGRAYLDKIVFLGDSTTYGIGFYYDAGYTDLAPPSQVWTPASGTLTLAYHSTATIVYPETGEELPIVEAVSRAKPEYMIITLGVNGISFMDEEWFIRDYTTLVQNILSASPDTKIILNSMYPVAASYPYQDDINNEKIAAGNRWIEQVAEANGVRYLNSFEAVVGADGKLPETSQNGDGLHLNGEAFTSVFEYIRTHAYK